MLGVANASVEQAPADPLANLEKLIKENSEIQAGTFQLQHEMRCALSERNDMRRELCEAVNKEKELVGALADLCKKVEQQKDVQESISQALAQVKIERTEQITRFFNAEIGITKHIDLIGRLQVKLKEARADLRVKQSQRDSTIAELFSEQSNLASLMLSLDNHQACLKESKKNLCELLTVTSEREEDILLLEHKISDAYFDTFNLQLSSLKRIEEFALESSAVDLLNLKLDSDRDEIYELEAQISKFQLLIKEDETVEATLDYMKASGKELLDNLDSWNSQLLNDLESEEVSKQQLIQLFETIVDLEKKCDLLQIDAFSSRKTKNSFFQNSSSFQDLIMKTLEDLAELEYNLHEKQNALRLLREKKQELLQNRSKVSDDFRSTVCVLSHRLVEIRRLKQLNEQCREIILKSQDPNSWEHFRHDLIELATACSRLQVHDLSATEHSIQHEAVTTTLSDCNLLVTAIDKLDLELQHALEKYNDFCENYHEKREQFRRITKKTKELQNQLDFCQKKAEENTKKISSRLAEQGAFYEQCLNEEQLSGVCDITSVPKEILDDMNNRKQQQARKYNERLCELQAQIEAASLGNNPAVYGVQPGLKRVGCRTNKLTATAEHL